MFTNSFENYNNVLISILLIKLIYSISNNKTYRFTYWILSSYNSINCYPVSISFIFEIKFSINNKVNLKKVSPIENISLFSGLNSPKPDLL